MDEDAGLLSVMPEGIEEVEPRTTLEDVITGNAEMRLRSGDQSKMLLSVEQASDLLLDIASNTTESIKQIILRHGWGAKNAFDYTPVKISAWVSRPGYFREYYIEAVQMRLDAMENELEELSLRTMNEIPEKDERDCIAVRMKTLQWLIKNSKAAKTLDARLKAISQSVSKDVKEDEPKTVIIQNYYNKEDVDE